MLLRALHPACVPCTQYSAFLPQSHHSSITYEQWWPGTRLAGASREQRGAQDVKAGDAGG